MNSSIAAAFYAAFARHDAAAMGACYADDATFSDPVFARLDVREVRAMWTMLLGRAAGMTVTHQILEETEKGARVAWTARYNFSQTGRPVVNEVVATRDYAGGRIVRHRDDFDFWRWSRQALGLKGLLFGRTPFLQHKVQAYGRKGLDAFLGSKPAV